MNEASLGRSVKEAFTFLGQVYDDVSSMISTLDRLMAEHGWKAPGNKISTELGNALNKSWLLGSLARIYEREGSDDRIQIIIEIDFAPEVADEPLMLAVCVEFAEPSSAKQTWDGWTRSDHLFAFLHQEQDVSEISKELLNDDFVHGASRAHGFCLPLCGLTDKNSLNEQVVKRLLMLRQ